MLVRQASVNGFLAFASNEDYLAGIGAPHGGFGGFENAPDR